ncbi:MAG: hypothetical protein ACFB15_21710 [Cyclobacteriaceae bacterium]
MGTIIHRIYINDELKMELESAGLYDTLSPYRMVANSFNDFNQLLKNGANLRIVSNDQEHLIKSEQEFRKWIKTKFNSSNNGGFEKYLNKKID